MPKKSAGFDALKGWQAVISTSATEKLEIEREAAETFVTANLHDLCCELESFEDTGLFGTGKLFELRQMLKYSGASSQSLALNMVKSEAVRFVANAKFEH